MTTVCDPLLRDWCDNDKVGFIMVYANDERLNGRVIAGDGNHHFQFDIRKKTPV